VTPVRAVLGTFGVLAAAYGVWLWLSRGHDRWDVVLWLAGGVVLHDAVLSAVVIVLGLLLVRVLPKAAQAPAAVGCVVLGSVTLLAVPVLGGFGARADNATLLDRNYSAGWLVLAGITIVAVIAASLVRSRRR